MVKKRTTGLILVILAILIGLISFIYLKHQCIRSIDDCISAYPYSSYGITLLIKSKIKNG